MVLPAISAACSSKGGAPEAPPAEVSVVTVTPQDIPWTFAFAAQAKPSQTVEVRSLVSGTLIARYFTEGTDVARGTPLYLIDPAPYEATYRSSQADLQAALARVEQTTRDLGRTKALFEGGAVSQRQYDDAQTAFEQATAQHSAARAAVDKAKVDLDRTRIVAEIPGRIGRTELQVGAQVPGPSTLLTTIEELDPIFVNIPVSDNERLAFQDDVDKQRLVPPARNRWRVQLVLADSSIFPVEGVLNFQELHVDAETGTSQLRAEFKNPGRRLLPNQFVRANLRGATMRNALLIPQRAVLQGLQGPYVYIVGPGDTVSAQDIVATSWDGGNWLIQSGLKPGDRGVVDGLQRVAAGRTVRPTTLKENPDSTPARREAPGGGA